MKDLFLAIQAYLLAQLPGITYVRMWNNQLDYMKGIGKEDRAIDENYTLPAIFIEFYSPNELEQLGNGNQIYSPLVIRLHIISEFYDAQDGTMGQDLVALELAQSVYQAFQDYMPEDVPLGVIVRKRETQDYDHPNIYHFIQECESNYIDDSMNRPRGGTLSVPILNLEIDLIGVWNDTTDYTEDQYVSCVVDNEVGIYQCIQDTEDHEPPTDEDFWTKIK